MALTKGNIMSGHHVSHMDGAVDLTPAILFAYTHKLYGKPIDTASVETYASLCAPQQYAEAANDPFALEELRTTFPYQMFVGTPNVRHQSTAFPAFGLNVCQCGNQAE